MLTKHALEVIVPFITTYLCEAGFSSLLTIKTKLQTRLVPKDDMRVALSTTVPRISEIVHGKQAQKSHWLTVEIVCQLVLKENFYILACFIVVILDIWVDLFFTGHRQEQLCLP